jgi:DNA-binding MarR family transcriptional regulator
MKSGRLARCQPNRYFGSETGLALADFDVLAQLAVAGGELRMTELAARALISRSGMTRRVARLVDEGLVRRANADADARGVVVALIAAGVARLTETAPVHLRGVSDLFVARLDNRELAVLESALNKVTVDCTLAESRYVVALNACCDPVTARPVVDDSV